MARSHGRWLSPVRWRSASVYTVFARCLSDMVGPVVAQHSDNFAAVIGSARMVALHVFAQGDRRSGSPIDRCYGFG